MSVTYAETDINELSYNPEFLSNQLFGAAFLSDTNDIVYGTEIVSLPSGYTQIEYVENTSNAYVNTKYVPKGDITVECKFMRTKNNSNPQILFGCRTNTAVDAFNFGCNANNSGIYAQYTNNSNSENYTTDLSLNTLYIVKFYKTGCDINNTNISSWTDVSSNLTNPSNLNIYLFNRNPFSSSDRRFYGRIYYFKLYKDSDLILNLIPCKNSSGTVGFYDIAGTYSNVDDGFYASANSTSFTGGDSVTEDSGDSGDSGGDSGSGSGDDSGSGSGSGSEGTVSGTCAFSETAVNNAITNNATIKNIKNAVYNTSSDTALTRLSNIQSTLGTIGTVATNIQLEASDIADELDKTHADVKTVSNAVNEIDGNIGGMDKDIGDLTAYNQELIETVTTLGAAVDELNENTKTLTNNLVTTNQTIAANIMEAAYEISDHVDEESSNIAYQIGESAYELGAHIDAGAYEIAYQIGVSAYELGYVVSYAINRTGSVLADNLNNISEGIKDITIDANFIKSKYIKVKNQNLLDIIENRAIHAQDNNYIYIPSNLLYKKYYFDGENYYDTDKNIVKFKENTTLYSTMLYGEESPTENPEDEVDTEDWFSKMTEYYVEVKNYTELEGEYYTLEENLMMNLTYMTNYNYGDDKFEQITDWRELRTTYILAYNNITYNYLDVYTFDTVKNQFVKLDSSYLGNDKYLNYRYLNYNGEININKYFKKITSQIPSSLDSLVSQNSNYVNSAILANDINSETLDTLSDINNSLKTHTDNTTVKTLSDAVLEISDVYKDINSNENLSHQPTYIATNSVRDSIDTLNESIQNKTNLDVAQNSGLSEQLDKTHVKQYNSNVVIKYRDAHLQDTKTILADFVKTHNVDYDVDNYDGIFAEGSATYINGKYYVGICAFVNNSSDMMYNETGYQGTCVNGIRYYGPVPTESTPGNENYEQTPCGLTHQVCYTNTCDTIEEKYKTNNYNVISPLYHVTTAENASYTILPTNNNCTIPLDKPIDFTYISKYLYDNSYDNIGDPYKANIIKLSEIKSYEYYHKFNDVYNTDMSYSYVVMPSNDESIDINKIYYTYQSPDCAYISTTNEIGKRDIKYYTITYNHDYKNSSGINKLIKYVFKSDELKDEAKNTDYAEGKTYYDYIMANYDVIDDYNETIYTSYSYSISNNAKNYILFNNVTNDIVCQYNYINKIYRDTEFTNTPESKYIDKTYYSCHYTDYVNASKLTSVEFNNYVNNPTTYTIRVTREPVNLFNYKTTNNATVRTAFNNYIVKLNSTYLDSSESTDYIQIQTLYLKESRPNYKLDTANPVYFNYTDNYGIKHTAYYYNYVKTDSTEVYVPQGSTYNVYVDNTTTTKSTYTAYYIDGYTKSGTPNVVSVTIAGDRLVPNVNIDTRFSVVLNQQSSTYTNWYIDAAKTPDSAGTTFNSTIINRVNNASKYIFDNTAYYNSLNTPIYGLVNTAKKVLAKNTVTAKVKNESGEFVDKTYTQYEYVLSNTTEYVKVGDTYIDRNGNTQTLKYEPSRNNSNGNVWFKKDTSSVNYTVYSAKLNKLLNGNSTDTVAFINSLSQYPYYYIENWSGIQKVVNNSEQEIITEVIVYESSSSVREHSKATTYKMKNIVISNSIQYSYLLANDLSDNIIAYYISESVENGTKTKTACYFEALYDTTADKYVDKYNITNYDEYDTKLAYYTVPEYPLLNMGIYSNVKFLYKPIDNDLIWPFADAEAKLSYIYGESIYTSTSVRKYLDNNSIADNCVCSFNLASQTHVLNEPYLVTRYITDNNVRYSKYKPVFNINTDYFGFDDISYNTGNYKYGLNLDKSKNNYILTWKSALGEDVKKIDYKYNNILFSDLAVATYYAETTPFDIVKEFSVDAGHDINGIYYTVSAIAEVIPYAEIPTNADDDIQETRQEYIETMGHTYNYPFVLGNNKKYTANGAYEYIAPTFGYILSSHTNYVIYDNLTNKYDNNGFSYIKAKDVIYDTDKYAYYTYASIITNSTYVVTSDISDELNDDIVTRTEATYYKVFNKRDTSDLINIIDAFNDYIIPYAYITSLININKIEKFGENIIDNEVNLELTLEFLNEYYKGLVMYYDPNKLVNTVTNKIVTPTKYCDIDYLSVFKSTETDDLKYCPYYPVIKDNMKHNIKLTKENFSWLKSTGDLDNINESLLYKFNIYTKAQIIANKSSEDFKNLEKSLCSQYLDNINNTTYIFIDKKALDWQYKYIKLNNTYEQVYKYNDTLQLNVGTIPSYAFASDDEHGLGGKVFEYNNISNDEDLHIYTYSYTNYNDFKNYIIGLNHFDASDKETVHLNSEIYFTINNNTIPNDGTLLGMSKLSDFLMDDDLYGIYNPIDTTQNAELIVDNTIPNFNTNVTAISNTTTTAENSIINNIDGINSANYSSADIEQNKIYVLDIQNNIFKPVTDIFNNTLDDISNNKNTYFVNLNRISNTQNKHEHGIEISFKYDNSVKFKQKFEIIPKKIYDEIINIVYDYITEDFTYAVSNENNDKYTAKTIHNKLVRVKNVNETATTYLDVNKEGLDVQLLNSLSDNHDGDNRIYCFSKEYKSLEETKLNEKTFSQANYEDLNTNKYIYNYTISNITKLVVNVPVDKTLHTIAIEDNEIVNQPETLYTITEKYSICINCIECDIDLQIYLINPDNLTININYYNDFTNNNIYALAHDTKYLTDPAHISDTPNYKSIKYQTDGYKYLKYNTPQTKIYKKFYKLTDSDNFEEEGNLISLLNYNLLDYAVEENIKPIEVFDTVSYVYVDKHDISLATTYDGKLNIETIYKNVDDEFHKYLDYTTSYITYSLTFDDNFTHIYNAQPIAHKIKINKDAEFSGTYDYTCVYFTDIKNVEYDDIAKQRKYWIYNQFDGNAYTNGDESIYYYDLKSPKLTTINVSTYNESAPDAYNNIASFDVQSYWNADALSYILYFEYDITYSTLVPKPVYIIDDNNWSEKIYGDNPAYLKASYCTTTMDDDYNLINPIKKHVLVDEYYYKVNNTYALYPTESLQTWKGSPILYRKVKTYGEYYTEFNNRYIKLSDIDDIVKNESLQYYIDNPYKPVLTTVSLINTYEFVYNQDTKEYYQPLYDEEVDALVTLSYTYHSNPVEISMATVQQNIANLPVTPIYHPAVSYTGVTYNLMPQEEWIYFNSSLIETVYDGDVAWSAEDNSYVGLVGDSKVLLTKKIKYNNEFKVNNIEYQKEYYTYTFAQTKDAMALTNEKTLNILSAIELHPEVTEKTLQWNEALQKYEIVEVVTQAAYYSYAYEFNVNPFVISSYTHLDLNTPIVVANIDDLNTTIDTNSSYMVESLSDIAVLFEKSTNVQEETLYQLMSNMHDDNRDLVKQLTNTTVELGSYFTELNENNVTNNTALVSTLSEKITENTYYTTDTIASYIDTFTGTLNTSISNLNNSLTEAENKIAYTINEANNIDTIENASVTVSNSLSYLTNMLNNTLYPDNVKYNENYTVERQITYLSEIKLANGYTSVVSNPITNNISAYEKTTYSEVKTPDNIAQLLYDTFTYENIITKKRTTDDNITYQTIEHRFENIAAVLSRIVSAIDGTNENNFKINKIADMYVRQNFDPYLFGSTYTYVSPTSIARKCIVRVDELWKQLKKYNIIQN